MTRLLLKLFVTSLSLAEPSPSVLEKISRSYDASFEAQENPMGSSFLFCPIKELRLSVQDPVLKTPGFISTKVYEPSSKNERDSERTILLLPPTGGENILDRGTANKIGRAHV